jgi:hypothetical protein
MRLALKAGEPRDLLPAGVAGGAVGLLGSAAVFAMIQSFDRVLGTWSTSIGAVVLLWATCGALLGVGSLLVVPFRGRETEVAR